MTMDNGAITPVIGTVILVAITVSLAAGVLALTGAFTGGIEPPDFETDSEPVGGGNETDSPGASNETPPDDSAPDCDNPLEASTDCDTKGSVEPLPGYVCVEAVSGLYPYICTRKPDATLG